jgi:hypothetical protein
MTRSFTLLLLALGACTGDPYKDDSPTDDSAVTDDTNTTDDSEDPGLDSTTSSAPGSPRARTSARSSPVVSSSTSL